MMTKKALKEMATCAAAGPLSPQNLVNHLVEATEKRNGPA
jgi:hypothetical protein